MFSPHILDRWHAIYHCVRTQAHIFKLPCAGPRSIPDAEALELFVFAQNATFTMEVLHDASLSASVVLGKTLHEVHGTIFDFNLKAVPNLLAKVYTHREPGLDHSHFTEPLSRNYRYRIDWPPQAPPAPPPSMDEILESIRKIIAEEASQDHHNSSAY